MHSVASVEENVTVVYRSALSELEVSLSILSFGRGGPLAAAPLAPFSLRLSRLARNCLTFSHRMPSYRLYAGGYEGKIVQLEFDPSRPAQERLKRVDDFACGQAPTWLTFSPDGTESRSFTAWQHADQSQDAHRSVHVVG